MGIVRKKDSHLVGFIKLHVFQIFHDILQNTDVTPLGSTVQKIQAILRTKEMWQFSHWDALKLMLKYVSRAVHSTIPFLWWVSRAHWVRSYHCLHIRYLKLVKDLLTLFSEVSFAPVETRIFRIDRWPNHADKSRAFIPNWKTSKNVYTVTWLLKNEPNAGLLL